MLVAQSGAHKAPLFFALEEWGTGAAGNGYAAPIQFTATAWQSALPLRH